MISTTSKSIMDKLQHISNEIWDQNIDDCVELKEGLTNDSFFVTVNQRYYIIRLNGAGTNELINRKNEKINYSVISRYNCACLAAFCWGSEVVLSYYGMTDMDPDVAITLRECISGGGTNVRHRYCKQSFYAEGNHRNSIWD